MEQQPNRILTWHQRANYIVAVCPSLDLAKSHRYTWLLPHFVYTRCLYYIWKRGHIHPTHSSTLPLPPQPSSTHSPATLDHPTVLFDIATQYKRDIPYTKDGTTTTQNKWPLATHTNTTVPDKPSSHLATTGHAHTHPRPNGGQLSAKPCALRLCIKATSDSRDRLSGGGRESCPEAGQPTTSRSTCHRMVTLLWSHESTTHSQFAAHHSLTQHRNKTAQNKAGVAGHSTWTASSTPECP